MNAKWLAFGLKLIPYIIAAVAAVEKFVKGKGPEKQDAAVAAIAAALAAAEDVAGKDLLDDAEVEAAIRAAADAIVHVQNVIAARKVA